MRHKLKMSIKEKINAYLDLCDLGYKMMKANLTPKEFAKRLKRIREEHLKKDYRILKRMANLG